MEALTTMIIPRNLPEDIVAMKVTDGCRLDTIKWGTDPSSWASAEWPYPDVVYVIRCGESWAKQVNGRLTKSLSVAKGTVLYVGHTTDLARRLQAHRRHFALADDTLDIYRGDAALERRLIEWYRPERNHQWAEPLRRKEWRRSLERRLVVMMENIMRWKIV